MNILKAFSLLFLLMLFPAQAFGEDDPSPFSSPLEKKYILETAGRDGQIDRAEWDANKTDRGKFGDLTWDKLLSADVNGDGLVGVNEFYRYIDNRMKNAAGAGEETEESNPTSEIRRRLQERLEDEESSGLDRRMLYKRAQIARRTKFQQEPDPQRERLLQESRRDHLKSITDRRRQAMAQLESIPEEDVSRLRELYKSRVVKNRLDTASESMTTRRDALKNLKRRRAAQNDDLSRRRRALSEIRRTNTRNTDMRRRLESATPRPIRPASIRQPSQGSNSRRSSDVRGTIPSRTKERVDPSRNKSRGTGGNERRGSQTRDKAPSPSNRRR